MKTLYKNAKILTQADSEIFDGEVLVDGSKIAFVGKKCPTVPDKTIDCGNNLLISGFCNAHAHSAMTLFRGIADDLPLKEWLFDRIFPLEDHLTEEDIYWGTKLALAEYASSGITAVADMYFFDPISKWTYVRPHEAYCGPYYYNIED